MILFQALDNFDKNSLYHVTHQQEAVPRGRFRRSNGGYISVDLMKKLMLTFCHTLIAS